VRALVDTDHGGSDFGVDLHVKLPDGNVDEVKRGEAHGKNGSGIRVHREGGVRLI